MVQHQLTAHIVATLEKLGLPSSRVELTHPVDMAHGDYATNVAFVCAKEAGQSPRALAERIVAALPQVEWISRIEIAGPGFINIHLSRTCVRDLVRTAVREGVRWGANTALEERKVLIEHTQPNPFKPFHIGHLMSNTIGESISRLYEFSGAVVRRANYQGDVGLHVAKCLWGLRKLGGDASSIEDLGLAYVEGNRAYEEGGDTKREIVGYNKMVYEHAEDIADEYKIGREVTLEHFEKIYAMLGSSFDYYFFESQSQVPGRTMVKEGLGDGIFVESEGAIVFPGEKYGLHTRVFMTRDGLPTYEAKELGLAQLKAEKWAFDVSITTTAVEQEEYFKVVYKALSLLRPEFAHKLKHVPHGMMVLTSGKMSSRKGNVVTGESLLEDTLAYMRTKVAERDLEPEEKEAIARAVAVAGVKFSVLKQKVGKNTTFDPDKELSFEGDSGPYLQYAHTRAVSVLEKAHVAGFDPSTALAPSVIIPLERLLYRFPEVVRRAQKGHEPHHVTTFLIELAAAWNSWYAVEKILDDSPTVPYKLAVVQAFVHTMKNGLWLLGIEAPEKM